MKTLSLDIQTALQPELDLTGFFNFSKIHAITNGWFAPVLDEIFPSLPEISLAKNTKISAWDFTTIPTLDIAHPDLLASPFWQRKYPELISRKRKIDLFGPQKIPLWSLDIRKGNVIVSDKKYSDLFPRKLPLALSVSKKFQKFSKNSFSFFTDHKKGILMTMATIFLTVLPIIFFIKFSIENGIETIASLKNSQNLSDFKSRVHSAKTDFDRAHFLFLPFSWIPIDSVDMINRATSSASDVLSSADALVSTLPENKNNFSLKVVENKEESQFRKNSKDIFVGENSGLSLPSEWIASQNDKISDLFSSIEAAWRHISEVRGNSKYALKMREAGKIISEISPVFDIYKNNSEKILTMLGNSDPERYIIFNQNRDEIRANGGFPGSIITFTLYKGNVLDYRTDDVYYYDWNLYPHVETPPPGIALLSNNYGLRDVNYYPDFRDTLMKANSFVERSGDSTLTTAIAIHQGLIEDILSIIGPVHLDGVNEDFTDKNFSLLMSLLVENKFGKEKTPKDILFQFIPAFTKKISESGKMDQIIALIGDYWTRGEIVMASRNDSVQDFLTSISKPLPWYSDSKNWAYPVFTSISGNKSDRYIDRFIETNIKSIGQCRYENTLTLNLEHKYSKADAEKLEEYMQKFQITDDKEKEKMRFIQGGGDNQTFVRLYVPKTAELSSSGAQITEEENAKIFSFTLKTPLGGKSSKTLKYTLEIPDCYKYNNTIDIYKQPGLRNLITL